MLATAENVGFEALSLNQLSRFNFGVAHEAGLAAKKVVEKEGEGGFSRLSRGFYGPDDRRASKVAVGIITAEGAETADLRRWFAESGDVRDDTKASAEIADFLRDKGVRSVVMTNGIIGCPHEEGIDYPEGEPCPHCPFWASRDRWAGV